MFQVLPCRKDIIISRINQDRNGKQKIHPSEETTELGADFSGNIFGHGKQHCVSKSKTGNSELVNQFFILQLIGFTGYGFEVDKRNIMNRG